MHNNNFKVKSQDTIINNLMLYDITDELIVDAILKVDMTQFLSDSLQSLAYTDVNVKYANNRFLMDIFTLGHMLKTYTFGSSAKKALVINSGNGYVGAVLSKLFTQVVTVDEDKTLILEAKEIYANLKIKNSEFILSNIESININDKFNLIIIDGAVPEVLSGWLDLLADGGSLVAVVNNDNLGKIVCYKKVSNAIINFSYNISPLPLIDKFVNKLATDNQFVF